MHFSNFLIIVPNNNILKAFNLKKMCFYTLNSLTHYRKHTSKYYIKEFFFFFTVVRRNSSKHLSIKKNTSRNKLIKKKFWGYRQNPYLITVNHSLYVYNWKRVYFIGTYFRVKYKKIKKKICTRAPCQPFKRIY